MKERQKKKTPEGGGILLLEPDAVEVFDFVDAVQVRDGVGARIHGIDAGGVGVGEIPLRPDPAAAGNIGFSQRNLILTAV